MEKNELIPLNSLALILAFGLALRFSTGVVKLLDIADAFGIRFGFCKSCLFFLGIGNQVLYDKSKPFFDYEATVGPVIAVMKKTIKVSSSEGGFKAVVLRKKRKGGVLAESIDNRKVAAKAPGAHSWGSETSDTTESKSIDMEEECLVEKTSVDYSESGAFVKENPNQMPKSLHVKTKKVLRKPLGVIDYGTVNTDNDVLDNSFLLLPPLPIKSSVQMPVRKFFALDIDLVAIAGKSSQEKLSFIRKIFSSVNGFGGTSTPLKFGRVICVTFTLEKAMIAAGKLANDCGVVVNTDLKCLVNNRTNQNIVIKEIPVGTSIEVMHAVVSEFGVVVSIKMQLIELWQKAIVTLGDFDQANLLASNSLGHTSRNCKSAGMSLSPKNKRASLLVQDWFRLAKIYERKFAPVSHPLAFGEKTWTSVVGSIPSGTSFEYDFQLGSIGNNKPLPPVVNDLKKCLVSIESSLVSLIGQIGEDIVMEVGSSNTTSDKTATVSGLTASPEVVKLENMLENLFALVMSLSALLQVIISAVELNNKSITWYSKATSVDEILQVLYLKVLMESFV
ncbi:hypothetical protein G9A89_005784 [Geosiphon pyriformis]|nr:hypothetical protein G9A89_005784 [Geosiphon pyriformis]